jgi:NAD(P)-dependent dehydrogenase (short-subunit alcohol dehydrogenase family)
MSDIDNKASEGTLIVTGAGRGIGRAVAKLASARGLSVAVNYAEDAHSATEVVRHIASSGGRAIAIQADVSREDEILRLFEAAERELGPLTGR